MTLPAHSHPELAEPHSRALAELLPPMLCGEESAVLAFRRHLRAQKPNSRARQEFARVTADEARHADELQTLQSNLPAPTSDAELNNRIRSFFRSLGSPHLGRHLGSIVALDSAVCLILGSLRRTRILDASPSVRRLFEDIHRDEAQHVVIARHYARELCPTRDLWQQAADTREQLATILRERACALDTLQVDPDRLFRHLRATPQRLFA